MEYLIRSVQMIRGRGSYNLAHFKPLDEARDTLLVRSWQAGSHPQKTIIQTGYNAMRKADLAAEFTAIYEKQMASGYQITADISKITSLGQVIEFLRGWEWWFNLADLEQQTKFLKYIKSHELAEFDEYSNNVLNLLEETPVKTFSPQPVIEPEVQPIEEPTVMVGFGAWA